MMLSASFYYKYFMGTPFKIILVLCVLLLGIQELLKFKLNIKSLLSMLIPIILFIITLRVSQDVVQNSVACIFIFIYCAREISFLKIAKFSIIFSSILLLFIILSSLVGIIDNYEFVKAGRSRDCLGFRYALYAPTFLFNITALWIYIRKANVSIKSLVILLLANLWFYNRTDSRITFFFSAILIVIAVLMKYKPIIFEKVKLIFLVLSMSYIFSALCSIIITMSYNKSIEWMRQLDTHLSYRIILGNKSILLNGISWFGKNISWVGNGLDAYGEKSTESYTYVDCFYVQILQHYGILFTIVIVTLLTIALLKFYQIKDYYLIIILSLIAFHCMIDDLSLYVYFNTFWFAAGIILFKSISIFKRNVPKY